MISWKKLVANAERFSSGSAAQKGLLTIDLPVSTILTVLLFGCSANILFGYPDNYFLDDAKTLPCFPLRYVNTHTSSRCITICNPPKLNGDWLKCFSFCLCVQKPSRKMELADSSCTDMASETADSNPNGISPLDQDTDFSCSLQEAKIVLDEQVGPCTLIKEKAPRATPTACGSVHADTSRTKETKQACVCCSELGQ
jgi:hypothetical protein